MPICQIELVALYLGNVPCCNVYLLLITGQNNLTFIIILVLLPFRIRFLSSLLGNLCPCVTGSFSLGHSSNFCAGMPHSRKDIKKKVVAAILLALVDHELLEPVAPPRLICGAKPARVMFVVCNGLKCQFQTSELF